MKQLEELEKKITHVIQKNKDLWLECNELKAQNKKLLEQNEELQMSIMKEASEAAVIAQEKDAMKATIEEILVSLDSLELAER